MRLSLPLIAPAQYFFQQVTQSLLSFTFSTSCCCFVRGKKKTNTFSPSKNKPSVRNDSPWSTSRSKLPDFLGGWTLLQRKSGNRQMERDSKGMDSCCTLYRRYRLNHSQHSTYWCPSACRGTQWFPPSNSRLAWKLQLFLKLLSVVVHTF